MTTTSTKEWHWYVSQSTVDALVDACRHEANDQQDGDLLCIVAETLRARADYLDKHFDGKLAHASQLRNFAERLLEKQYKQRIALESLHADSTEMHRSLAEV